MESLIKWLRALLPAMSIECVPAGPEDDAGYFLECGPFPDGAGNTGKVRVYLSGAPDSEFFRQAFLESILETADRAGERP